MSIAVTGASGFVGQALCRALEEEGGTCVAVKIRPSTPVGEITAALEGCDAVVNLAGANILGRWSESYKQLLYDSRIDTTTKLVEALEACTRRPPLLLSASAVGIYPNDEEVDEFSGRYAEDFLAKLCMDWEACANEASRFGVRVAVMRFGVIYGPGGGALQKMLLPFRLGLGGRLASGTQKVSWIHIDDLVGAMRYIMAHETLKGVFNMSAPETVTNAEQTECLAEVLHRPAFFTVPEFMIKLIFGEGAGVMLDSKDVRPRALLEAGYDFRYPGLKGALEASVR
jgi:uncharacterized protein